MGVIDPLASVRTSGAILRGAGRCAQLPLLAWLFVNVACEPPEDIALPGGVHFVDKDSAGVAVATTLGTRARSPVGWAVDPVPEYQVGAREGDEPYLFSSIAGARQFSDGRVVALDRTSCELRFFGADGVFLDLAAGRGDGPGEFRVRCVLVPSQSNDSLFVQDRGRLNVFDDQGRFSHGLALYWPNHLAVSAVVGVAEGVAGIETGRLHRPPLGDLSYPPEPADFGMLDLETGRVIWEENGFQRQRKYSNDVSGGLTAILPFPFDIRPTAAMGTGGLFLTLGEDHGPEIRQYGSAGLSRVFRLAEPVATAPSAEDIRSLIEFEFEPYDMQDSTRQRIFQSRRRRYGELQLPKIKPVFSRLLIDDAGWLWAELYRFQLGAPVRWLVFDPDGEGVGSVDLPPGLHVWQVGHDFVLGVWEDELGVEYVRRHALMGRR